MAGTQPRNSSQPPVGSETLTCQWCAVQLPPGETICPTCGSPGIPDESMIVPGSDEIEPLHLGASQAQRTEEELVEWWDEGSTLEEPRGTEGGEDDLLPLIAGLGATAVVCILLGVIVAPMLLASVFENQLGVVVEDNADLRPLGGLLGILTAAFIGAIGVWIAGPRR